MDIILHHQVRGWKVFFLVDALLPVEACIPTNAGWQLFLFKMSDDAFHRAFNFVV